MKKFFSKLNDIKKLIIKNKTIAFCFSIIIISSISIFIQMSDKNDRMSASKISSKDSNDIAVYVIGCVKNPGVYYLDSGSRLYQLLDLCGGVTQDADVSSLNLSKKLSDSDMINILAKKDETENIENEENNLEKGKININTATLEELKTLDGIGEQTAQKIINYRKEQRFQSIEDIMNVPGIGESKFLNIENDICI